MRINKKTWAVIGILAITQIASWGSLYYAFSILAPDIRRELGWSSEVVFGAFSWSLLVAGLIATPVGILLDRFGGRLVMTFGSLVCGAGFITISKTNSVSLYFFACTVLGASMALVLYQAAFATINRELTVESRKGISTLTLFGGLASTAFWPLTLKLNTTLGWRDTYFIFGVVQLALCAPLHLLLPRQKRQLVHKKESTESASKSLTLNEALRNPIFWSLVVAFSLNSLIFSGLSVHLIPILGQLGHPVAIAVTMAMLIGPTQVAGRIGEMTIFKNTPPQTVGKIVFSTVPVALVTLLLFGRHEVTAALFCLLYGLSNGILTIARATIPQELFGRANYGAISGALSTPSMVCKAAGPLVLGMMLQLDPSPYPMLSLLLLLALISSGFYLLSTMTSMQKVRASS